ncbi:MAG: hypothetical protein M0Z60_00070 [Nitrospiraceae bacterium]|nr:hypothetical protein [Nitrospiraceae bacterium]
MSKRAISPTAVVLVLMMCLPAFADLQRYRVPVGDSPEKGPKDAPVTIIEFLDFQ